MNVQRNYLCLIFSIFLLVSCGSSKDINYFQGVDQFNRDVVNYSFNYEVVIESNDNLLIRVSSLNAEAAKVFNVVDLTGGMNSSTLSYQGYLVDSEGYINFPVVGSLKIAGLTKQQAIELIKEKVAQFIVDPVINIRFLNYKVTVLGEVNKPGTYTIEDEKITILEALGLAGEMSIYGKRTNILVCRENHGKKEFGRLDMSSADVFNSPYFYLQQNDVVYVEPNKSKASTSTYNQNLPLILSAISTLATVSALIISITNK